MISLLLVIPEYRGHYDMRFSATVEGLLASRYGDRENKRLGLLGKSQEPTEPKKEVCEHFLTACSHDFRSCCSEFCTLNWTTTVDRYGLSHAIAFSRRISGECLIHSDVWLDGLCENFNSTPSVFLLNSFGTGVAHSRKLTKPWQIMCWSSND